MARLEGEMTVLHGLQQYEYRECMGGTVKEDLFSLPKKILCNRRGFKNSTGDTKIVGEATYQAVDDMACVPIKIKIFATIDLLKAVHLPLRCCEHLVPTTTYRKKLTTVGRYTSIPHFSGISHLHSFCPSQLIR